VRKFARNIRGKTEDVTRNPEKSSVTYPVYLLINKYIALRRAIVLSQTIVNFPSNAVSGAATKNSPTILSDGRASPVLLPPYLPRTFYIGWSILDTFLKISATHY
jgi:hypothetical protein